MTKINPSKAYIHNRPAYTGEFTAEGKAITVRHFPISSDKVTAFELAKAGHKVSELERCASPWDHTAWAWVDGVGYRFEVEA